MKWRTIDTKKGTRCRVLEGGSGTPIIVFHGAGGLLADNPFLDGLAQRHHVFAPEWPGYGDSTGDELLEDMLHALHAIQQCLSSSRFTAGTSSTRSGCRGRTSSVTRWVA